MAYRETPHLSWMQVGVFRHGGIAEAIININKKDVKGKLLNVMGLFITCPNNVLREK